MSKYENVGLLKQRIKDYASCDEQLCQANEILREQNEKLLSFICGLNEDSKLFQTVYKDIDEVIEHITEARSSLVHAVSAIRFTKNVAEAHLSQIWNVPNEMMSPDCIDAIPFKAEE